MLLSSTGEGSKWNIVFCGGVGERFAECANVGSQLSLSLQGIQVLS